MKQILKHSFEAVSLLTTENGLLDITIIPATNQPDWIVPSSLVLSVDDFDGWVWNYQWQQQEVAVFHLLPPEKTPSKMIVLEGNTSAHRIALQTTGEIKQRQVRISDVKDIDLPERYVTMSQDNEHAEAKTSQPVGSSHNANNNDHTEKQTSAERFRENVVLSYLFQTVAIDSTPYLVADLDKIAHQLVDLDS